MTQLDYAIDQIRYARSYLEARASSPASDALRRAEDALLSVREQVGALRALRDELENSEPDEETIQGALDYGRTAEQHLKGGDPRG